MFYKKWLFSLLLFTVWFGAVGVSHAQNPTNVWRGQYFNNQRLQGNPVVVRDDREINFDWGSGAPDSRVPADHFSARWTRDLYFTAGRYKFMTRTDDGVRLYVNGQLIIDRWYDQGAAWQSVEIGLNSGTHTVVMEYFDNVGGAVAHLHWDRLGDAGSTAGYRGEYFNNRNLSGQPSVVRTDGNIDFTWPHEPVGGINANDFSVRWTQTRFFEAGRYQFNVTADDGVRLYVNNRLLIDQWRDQSAKSFSAEIDLPGGDIPIKLEFYDHQGSAVIKLNVIRISRTQFNNWRGEYFNNANLSGSPVLVRDDGAIDFAWGDGSPDWSTLPSDNFSVRWTRNLNLQSGRYRFTATTDDGVRLWVNNQLIIDQWTTKTEVPLSAEIQIVHSGNIPVKLEYFERGGNATAKLNWQLVGGQAPTGLSWRGEYFNNINLVDQPVIVRTDSAINFNWGSISPDVLINRDNFSARWTANPRFDGGRYRFTVRADDGMRISIDGVHKLDRWYDQSGQTVTFEADLTAGIHHIIVEYYERGGSALAFVNWERIGNPPTQPPSGAWRGEYFNNRTLSGAPTVVRQDAAIDFVWGNNSPSANINADNFSVRWTQTVNLPAGLYRFTVRVDDGVRLWLNNRIVIDQWVDGGGKQITIEYNHIGGNLPVKMEYYDSGWWAQAQLGWTQVR